MLAQITDTIHYIYTLKKYSIKLNFYLMSYTKINSKWIEELNYKILGRKHGGKLHDIPCVSDFLNIFSSRGKMKLENWTVSKLKSSVH